MSRLGFTGCCVASLAMQAAMAKSPLAQSPVELVSVATGGQPGPGSLRPWVSANGRVVAFESWAALSPADGNGISDVYVRDRDAGTTVLASANWQGSVGNFGARHAALSGDGRFVVFDTPNALVPGDTAHSDVFVRDLWTAVTQRVAIAFGGGPPNGDSYPGTISRDGRYVAFLSLATNLIANDTNGGSFSGRDVYVRDMQSGAIEIASINAAGQQANDGSHYSVALSHDGRFVLFSTAASNLVSGDTNGRHDIFVRDRVSGTTECVSTAPGGVPGNDSVEIDRIGISDDGRYIAFSSYSTNLVVGDTNGKSDIFVRDRWLGMTQCVSRGPNGVLSNGTSNAPTITADGRWVVVKSAATNLDSGNAGGVFAYDMTTDKLRRIARKHTGDPVLSSLPIICADGSTLVFDTTAANVIPGLAAGPTYTYAVDIDGLTAFSYCTASTSSQGCVGVMAHAGFPSASAPSGFVLSASGVAPDRAALLLYGTTGSSTTPFYAGTLCINPPVKRGAFLQTSAGATCAGTVEFDFNRLVASQDDPQLTEGRAVWSQYWVRDGGGGGISLTNGVFFEIQP